MLSKKIMLTFALALLSLNVDLCANESEQPQEEIASEVTQEQLPAHQENKEKSPKESAPQPHDHSESGCCCASHHE